MNKKNSLHKQASYKNKNIKDTKNKYKDAVKTLNEDQICDIDIQSLFLKKVNSFPMLTRKEEILLSKKIINGKNSLILLNKFKNEQTLLSVQQIRLLKRRVSAGNHASRKLFNSNLKLAVFYANRYKNNNCVSILDLYQEASIGLMRAVNSYNYKKGAKFSTYATPWIIQHIIRFIDKHSRNVPISIHNSEKVRKYQKIKLELTQSLNKNPSLLDIAQAMNLNIDNLRQLLIYSEPENSLNAQINSEESIYLEDVIKDEKFQNPEEAVLHKNALLCLIKAIYKLDNNEKVVLRSHFGIGRCPKESLENIGRKLGYSRATIKNIENKALSKINESLGTNVDPSMFLSNCIGECVI